MALSLGPDTQKGALVNRTVISGVALALALFGPVSAQTLRGVPGLQNPEVIAGEVAANGAIVKGTGFIVRYLNQGRYEVLFRTPFEASCPVMTVTVASNFPAPPIAQVNPHLCGRSYRVSFWSPTAKSFADQAFDFVAVATQ